jgi:hypothetical protein
MYPHGIDAKAVFVPSRIAESQGVLKGVGEFFHPGN